jgi:translation initiation factor IF-3
LIRAPEVRVIDVDGHQVGILPIREALRVAETRGLDLVEVAPTARPPVCRVVDFDKYRYSVKKKEPKSHAAATAIKEVKMGALTEKHDVEFKVGHIRRFLGEGRRVKVTISFRGRQMAHPELGRTLLEKVLQMVQDVSQAEGAGRMEGRNLSVLLTPK